MRLLHAVPLVALASLAFAATSASADPLCTGTAEDAKICVDPAGTPGVGLEGSLVSRCVFVPGMPDCQTVAVPGVRVTSGDVPLVTCDGPQCPGGVPDPGPTPIPGTGECGNPMQRGPVLPRVIICIAEGHVGP